jgi:hypothetical protein
MSRRARGGALALALVAIAATAALAWRGVLELALLGWDSYPLVLAGRIESAADLAATFSEELMDGAYPLGRFWRPVVHLAFGLEFASWRLDPAGYHAVSLAVLALCACATFLLARKLLGEEPWVAGLVAACLYALHPIQVEILTVPARLAEGLAVLFTLLALLAQPIGGERRGRAWLAGLCCALALASKETGAMATGMVVALALASSRERRPLDLARDALRAAYPSLVLFGLAFAARTAALSGLGGSAESSLTANLASSPGILRGYLHALATPSGAEGSPLVSDALFILLVALVVRLARSSAGLPRLGEAQSGLAPARCALFLALALFVVALVTSVSGLERGWYALPFLPLYALGVALALELGLRAIRRGPKLAGACSILLVLRLAALPLFAVPIDGALEPFRRASDDERSFLERFDAAVAAAPAGSTVSVAGLPTERRADPQDPRSPNILMLAPYSVGAYARLRFPERAIRIEIAGRASGRAAQPGELVVVLAP